MFSWPQKTRGKNILLIIDPQIDFHTGSLAVPHAIEDAKKIVELINSGKFDEIHVSLDTHTKNHIGHPGFYDSGYVPFGNYYNGEPVKDEEGNDLGPKKDDEGNAIPKTVAKQKIVQTDVALPPDYLETYNEIHKTARNTDYMMWPEHCIEGSDGHKIYKPIHDALQNAESVKHVRYHIKGQNELTEMYSIFSATVKPPVSYFSTGKRYNPDENGPTVEENKIRKSSKLYYTNPYKKEEGVRSYVEACKYINLDTSMNTGLINNLCGKEGQNTVYVCGQAKSHCVADSIIDLLKVGKGEVVLIEDASSPVLTDPEKEQLNEGKEVKSFLLGIAEDNISKAEGGKAKFSKISTSNLLQKLEEMYSDGTVEVTGYDKEELIKERLNSSRKHPEIRKSVVRSGGRKTRKNKRTKRTKAKRANKKKRKNTQRR